MNRNMIPLIIIIITSMCSSGLESRHINDNYISKKNAFVIKKQLDSAYFRHDNKLLEKIFTDWNKMVLPNSIEYINQNNLIEAVFESFKEFYQPLNLLKLGHWEWGDALNKGANFIVVQNSVYYAVNDIENTDKFNWKKNTMDSIKNFRPPVNIKTSKVLYLTSEYDSAINNFLGNESSKLGEGDIMNPSQAIGESEKRYEFLRAYIPILHGHWGGYWHISTHPDVWKIGFNKSLSEARFYFRVGYQGGEAVLIKTKNGWKIKESKSTWIE